jgi:hypothetical protein
MRLRGDSLPRTLVVPRFYEEIKDEFFRNATKSLKRTGATGRAVERSASGCIFSGQTEDRALVQQMLGPENWAIGLDWRGR